MFNNYNLTDDDVIGILNKYENLINKYSRLYPGGPIDEDLKGEITFNETGKGVEQICHVQLF